MRSTTLGLLLLVSVRAVFNMGGAARGEGGRTTPLSTPTTDPRLRSAHGTPAKFRNVTPNSGTPADARLSPAPLASVPSPRPSPPNVGPASDPELPEETPRDVPAAPGPEPPTATRDSIPTVDPAVFNKRRYRSPRVLFSAHPPDAQGGAGAGAGARVRRRAGQTRHRGVYSVCDSVSNWVGNKTSAVDIRGNEVAVLPDVRINNIVKKQYFFETTCHGPARPARAGGGCLGIDSRSWNSYCTNTHTFVLAMTSFKSLVAWRLVRINAACVCVLSRKSWRH